MQEEKCRSRIEVQCEGHDFYYPVSDILRLFTGSIPREEHDSGKTQEASVCPNDVSGIVVCDAGRILPDGETIVIRCRVTDEIVETYVVSEVPEEKSYRAVSSRDLLVLPLNREVKRQLYSVLSARLQKAFPWGSLTGIRPTQVARELASEKEMSEIYGVREDKAHLAFITRDEEDRVLDMTTTDSLHIYIGIPFCPTRCAYCSFVAQEAPRKTELLPSYVDAMLREMELVLPHITQKLETLYVGGGTPTVLDETLLRKLRAGITGTSAFG